MAKSTKIYVGCRLVNDQPCVVVLYNLGCGFSKTIGLLDPRNDLLDHSPDGFNWGYAGSGPAQLAFALVLDHSGDAKLAEVVYQQFKFDVVAKLPWQKPWALSAQQVQNGIDNVLRPRIQRDSTGPF